MKSRLLVFLLALFCFQACQEDNFDEITEEILPFEPTEVTQDDIALTYRIQNEEVVYDDGFGVALHSEFGLSIYAIASGDFTCTSFVDSNSISLSIGGRINDFFISWNETADGTITANSASVKTVIAGDTTTVFGGFNINPECVDDEIPFLVNIEGETEEYLKGNYEAEFFQLVLDSTASGITCDNWQSVGVLSADFFVPLGECQ